MGLFGMMIFFPGCLGGGGGSEGTKAFQSSAGQAEGNTGEGTTAEENPSDGNPVEIANQAPSAYAGIDQTVPVGVTASLDGTLSSDPNGDSLSYQWQIISCPTGSIASLSGSNQPNPTFSPDRPGDYTIQLVVTDSKGLAG